MSVQFTRSDDVLCALLSGEIDHHTASYMRMLIDSEAERTLPKTLILDFSEVLFMDSSGIGLILGRKKYMEAMDGAVFIKNTPSYVRKIISLAGLERLILSDNAERKM